MNLYSAVISAICLVGLTGCESLGRTARINPTTVSARPLPNECDLTASLAGDENFAIDLGCFTFDPIDRVSAYRMATSTGTPEQMRAARNRLEPVLLTHADAICEEEKGNLYANRAMSNSILDFLSSGFSISSTIVGGELAKSILSGAAGLSTATRTNVDANVYQNQIVPAITKVMDAERARILTQMQAKRSSNVADYPTDEMIRLANTYHQACSFQRGMQLLLDAAVNKEGLDRIVEGMNLRTATRNLVEQRNILSKLDSPEADEKIKEIDKQIGELALLNAQNAKDAEAVLVASDNDDP